MKTMVAALTSLALVLALGCASVFLLLGALGVVAVGSGYVLGTATCDAQTQNIGYPHRYDFFGGCQIEVETGRWVPLDSYYFKDENQ